MTLDRQWCFVVPEAPLLRHGGAGEWPCGGFPAKSCLDGVVFDVTDCALLLDRIPYPTVKIVFAPERACSAQQSIRLLCAGHLNPRNHSGQVNQWAEQEMNVVGHHDPGPQFVEALLLPSRKGIRHCQGDVVTSQPLRTGSSRVENPIEGDKFGALAGPEICVPLYGKRADKTPRQKIGRARPFPMGQARVRGVTCTEYLHLDGVLTLRKKETRLVAACPSKRDLLPGRIHGFTH